MTTSDAGSPVATVISTSLPTARKQHICFYCGTAIRVGTPYLRMAAVDGSALWTIKAHQDCNDAALKAIDVFRLYQTHWEDDGYPPLYEMLEDVHERNAIRGFFPHAICRVELAIQKREMRHG